MWHRARQHNTSWTTRSIIAGIGAGFLYFIIFFLKPFDIGENPLPHKYLYFIGYSVIFFVTYMIVSWIEDHIISTQTEEWSLKQENYSMLFLFVIGTTLIYIYDILVIKEVMFSFSRYIDFMFRISLPFAVLVIPVIFIARMRLGQEQDQSPTATQLTLRGDNKDDILNIDAQNLLLLQSADNYTKVIYLDASGQSQQLMMRARLSQLLEQAGHMTRCHRSYAINLTHLKSKGRVKGKVYIQLHHWAQSIPVSRTYNAVIAMSQCTSVS